MRKKSFLELCFGNKMENYSSYMDYIYYCVEYMDLKTICDKREMNKETIKRRT